MTQTTGRNAPGLIGALGPKGLLDRTLSGLERALLGALVVALFAMMILISADAVGRYSMNRPVGITVDLVTLYLLPATMLIPAGLVLRNGGHIGVDLFAQIMPRRFYNALVGLGLLAAIPVFWIMSYRLVLLSHESWLGNIVATGDVPWPTWAEQAVFALAMSLFTLRLAHIAISQLAAAMTGNAAVAISLLPDDEERQTVEEGV